MGATMGRLALYAVYFALGMVQDVLIAKYYIFVSHRRAFSASVLAFIITALTVLVLENIITSNQAWPLLSYAVGTAVGTFWGVRHGKDK
jgi:hypothetical protein